MLFRSVSKILLIETLLIGFFALIAGLIAGVFLSQGLAMLTAKMFAVQMKEFKFVFSQTAFIQTIMYFAIIFIIVMIFNGITISKYKLINLLNAAKKNQKTRLKNPVLSVILFVISIACIGIAYHLITKNQMLGVDNDFKMSIILGVIGTFLFFFSLSGFLLELAKRNKKFYYNGLNMFVLRQINSKITTTFVSMSMLCLNRIEHIKQADTKRQCQKVNRIITNTFFNITKCDFRIHSYCHLQAMLQPR